MMNYELIDRTDNDVHDTGTREEMQAYADERNASDDCRVWIVKPCGYSASHFKGCSVNPDNLATYLTSNHEGQRARLAKSFPGTVIGVVCPAHVRATDRMPKPATVNRGMATPVDTVPVIVSFQSGESVTRQTLTVSRLHPLFRLTMPSLIEAPFEGKSDSVQVTGRAMLKAQADRVAAVRSARLTVLESVGAAKLKRGSRPASVARVIGGTFGDSESASLVWAGCQRASRSVCQSMQLLETSDVEDVAGDSFRAICERVSIGTLTFAECLSEQGSALPVFQAVRRSAGELNAGRGNIDWQADWQVAGQSDDCTGRNTASETARQVVWRDCLRAIVALSAVDPAVRSYVANRLSVAPVASEAIDVAEAGANPRRTRERVLLASRNAGAVSIGRARRKHETNRTLKPTERAALALSDIVAQTAGSSSADTAGGLPGVWSIVFDRIAQARKARIKLAPVSVRADWRMLANGKPSASDVILHSDCCGCDDCRNEVRPVSDISAVLTVLHRPAFVTV